MLFTAAISFPIMSVYLSTRGYFFPHYTPLYCTLVSHPKSSYFLVTLGLNDVKDNEPSPPLLLLVLKTELKDTAATKLLEITATDGQAKARLLAWGSIAQFFHTKIKEKETYLFENTVVKATPTRYVKADMIPFDITLNSGATISPKKANIQIPEPNFTMIADTLQSMINRRTNLRALIIDYDESVSNVSLQSGSVATKRELSIADNTGFKIQATLWGETANTFRPQLGRAVVIENALIKSYLQNVTASVDKIAYCSDSHSQELELWYERHGDDEIEQLCATPKRRLATNEYPLLDNVSTLSSIEDGTCVKIRDKITSLEFTEYDACGNCKTGVVQMGSDNFCPKCSKTNVPIAQKVLFTLSLSKFAASLKLYHDNVPNLLNLKDFIHLSRSDQESVMQSLCATYTILVVKRQNRLKTKSMLP